MFGVINSVDKLVSLATGKRIECWCFQRKPFRQTEYWIKNRINLPKAKMRKISLGAGRSLGLWILFFCFVVLQLSLFLFFVCVCVFPPKLKKLKNVRIESLHLIHLASFISWLVFADSPCITKAPVCVDTVLCSEIKSFEFFLSRPSNFKQICWLVSAAVLLCKKHIHFP